MAISVPAAPEAAQPQPYAPVRREREETGLASVR
jgi:hypothetical protein